MKILYVIHTPRNPQTAVYQICLHYQEYFRTSHHGMDIVTPDDLGLSRAGRWLPLIYPAAVLVYLLSRYRAYDLIIFHSYCGWMFNLLRKCLPGRPGVVTAFHGVEQLFFRELADEMRAMNRKLSLRFRFFQGFLMDHLIRISCRSSDAVFCLNRKEREFLVRNRLNLSENIKVLPNGISDAFFDGSSTIARPSPYQLLFVGHWLPAKGIRYLRDAFCDAASQESSLRLRIVGCKISKEELLKDFPQDLHARIEVVPAVDHEHIVRYYERAGIFVFPSLSEGFSMALLEAMAAGLGIIATPAGAAEELIRNNENGILVPIRNSRAISAAILGLVADPRRIDSMGRAARNTAEAYRMRHTLEIFLNHCLKLLSAKASSVS